MFVFLSLLVKTIPSKRTTADFFLVHIDDIFAHLVLQGLGEPLSSPKCWLCLIIMAAFETMQDFAVLGFYGNDGCLSVALSAVAWVGLSVRN
jgi:hypothetical protein